MAITTLSGLRSGVKPLYIIQKASPSTANFNRTFSTWPFAGTPTAGGAGSSLNGDVCTAATAGAVQIGSGSGLNTYLASFKTSYILGTAASTTYGVGTYICDRIWHNTISVTTTTAQTITSPTWPSRDVAGSTNGDGILLGVEIVATVGAGAPTISVSYTNSANVSGRTATSANLVPQASAPAGTFYVLDLQAGDTGVRSVQSITINASWVSGTVAVVAYRPIAATISNINGRQRDTGAFGLGMARVYDNSCLFFLWTNIGSNTNSTMPFMATLKLGMG